MAVSLSSMMGMGQPAPARGVVPEQTPANPIEQAYFQRLAAQYPQLIAEYAAHPESKGGRIINTDVAREMSRIKAVEKELKQHEAQGLDKAHKGK